MRVLGVDLETRNKEDIKKLIIAKIETDRVCDYNMTIMFTHGWMDRDNNYMEQEFNSL